MGKTLDQLLDITGIGDMSGKQYEKTAAPTEPPTFRKLAEQCRAAADRTDEYRYDQGRSIVEKTAAVAVIARTIDEINEICGEPIDKIASDEKTAGFINAAINKGHDPADIAIFLKQAGLGGHLRRGLQRVRSTARQARGEKLTAKGRAKGELAVREQQDLLRQAERSGNLNRQQREVENLTRKHGDKRAKKILEGSGADLDVPAAQRLLYKEAPRPAAGISIGGKDIPISKKNLKRGGLVAGGAVATKSLTGGDKGGGGGVTVIRR